MSNENEGKGKAIAAAITLIALGQSHTVVALGRALGLKQEDECDNIPGVLHMRDQGTKELIPVEFEDDEKTTPVVHKCRHNALLSALRYGTSAYNAHLKAVEEDKETAPFVPSSHDFAFIPQSEMEMAEVNDTSDADAYLGSIRLRK